jgi:hypothetical protein
VNPGGGAPWIYRADLSLADGQHRVVVRSRDIVGNESLDSLEITAGSLSYGEELGSPDGRLWLGAGDGTRWVVS